MTKQTRNLKIEAIGNFAKNEVIPRIRLNGKWLERAGFKPGHRVEIVQFEPGILSLHFQEDGTNQQT